MFQIGDIVIFHNKKYKIDFIRSSGRGISVKMHSVQGKHNVIMNNVPIEMLVKDTEQEV